MEQHQEEEEGEEVNPLYASSSLQLEKSLPPLSPHKAFLRERLTPLIVGVVQ